MNRKYLSLILPLLFFNVGCSHLAHKVDGPQEQSEIPAGIRVSVGGKEVKEGDTLTVFQTTCHKTFIGDTRPRSTKECHDGPIGTAIVLKVLDHDSAIVTPQNGLVMNTSMRVEKQKGEKNEKR